MMLGSHTSHSYSRKFLQQVESVFRPTYICTEVCTDLFIGTYIIYSVFCF